MAALHVTASTSAPSSDISLRSPNEQCHCRAFPQALIAALCTIDVLRSFVTAIAKTSYQSRPLKVAFWKLWGMRRPNACRGSDLWNPQQREAVLNKEVGAITEVVLHLHNGDLGPPSLVATDMAGS